MAEVRAARRSSLAPLLLRETRARSRLAPGAAVAARMLQERYGNPADGVELEDGLFEFQRDAAVRARSILARRGGVLIADSVGLGKTHVALELLRPPCDAGARITIVGPAALERHWRNAGRDLGTFEWLSYARLGRGTVPSGPRDFVVFDEAHALRNPATRRYRWARSLATRARVVLLSATPVNNSLWDLYHLLRLFAGDRDFADVGVPSLRAAFEEAKADCLLGSAPAIRPVLRAVVIRRTRAVLGADGGDVARRFPRQERPVPVYYAFSAGSEPDVLGTVGRALLELDFPVHRTAGSTPVELLRRSLLKRLESSKHALARSVSRYDTLLRKCADALGRGLLVGVAEGASDDADQLAFDELLYRPVGDGSVAKHLAEALQRERAIVGRVRDAIEAVTDRKLAALEHLLDGPLRGRRLILFTQFRDTARYLHERLLRRFRVALIDGAGALLGSALADRAAVVRRFAPVANAAPRPPAHEEIDVLVATDVLSEGFNLQDASVVVSYDLPWNPIRLVQRVGRIDRLGSTHSTVASYHFLPGDLDRYLGLVDRLAAKTSTIEATVGCDMPSLHADLVRALDRRDASYLTRIEDETDPLALEERLRALQRRIPVPEQSSDFVYATLQARQHAASCVAVVAARVGANVEWVAVVDGRARYDERLCAELLEAASTQTRCGEAVPPDVLEAVLCTARRELMRRQAAAAAAPLLPSGGAANRIGRRLLELVADLPGGAEPVLYARVEAAMDRLARGPEACSTLAAGGEGPSALQLQRLLNEIEKLPVSVVPAPARELQVELIGALVVGPCER